MKREGWPTIPRTCSTVTVGVVNDSNRYQRGVSGIGRSCLFIRESEYRRNFGQPERFAIVISSPPDAGADLARDRAHTSHMSYIPHKRSIDMIGLAQRKEMSTVDVVPCF